MKITIQRHGGYAGTSELVATKDAATPESAAACRATVGQIKNLSRGHCPVGADFIRYELVIEDSGSRETISFADDGSDQARQLADLVSSLAGA